MADPTTQGQTAVDPELLKALLAASGGLQPIGGSTRAPSDLALATTIAATRPMSDPSNSRVLEPEPEAPSIGGDRAAPALQPIGTQPSAIKPLTFKERQALPLISPGVSAGSSGYYENKLERLQDQTDNPLGSAENHPGTPGKIGHVLGKIGNIAGEIVAPRTMALIPGTDLNRQEQIAGTETRLAGAKKQESESGLQAAETGKEKAETGNIESETRARDAANKEDLVSDPQGNVTGWKDKAGALHSLEEPGTPQAIKDIASDTANKLAKPSFEKDENNNIVKLSTDKDGKTTSEIVYKGDPKVKTETRDVMEGGKLHSMVFDVTPNSATMGKKLADLGETKVAGAEAAGEHGIEIVMAYDKDNKAHLLSKADAEKEGYTHITKATDKDINDAKTHTITLNDMQTKLNDVIASRKALDQDAAQRAIIAKALSDKKNTTLGQLVDAGVLAGATSQTQEYVQSVLSLRESALGLPKEITGGSRVSEIQASALWGTLPSGASLNGDYALRQGKKFQANIDRLRQRAPEVRGVDQTEPHPDLTAEKKPGVADVNIVRDAGGQIDWKKTLGIDGTPSPGGKP